MLHEGLVSAESATLKTDWWCSKHSLKFTRATLANASQLLLVLGHTAFFAVFVLAIFRAFVFIGRHTTIIPHKGKPLPRERFSFTY
jgi:hypothetical protein